MVALYIERDEAGGSAEPAEAEPTWRVRLALDLPALGPVQFDAWLQGQRFGCRILSEQEATATLFRQHLDTLEARLSASGLVVAGLQCHTGQVREPLSDIDLPALRFEA
ncbi:MAG: flagellar hook-length control protein FliK [Gammaproteobacteria bacterium]|nr:MAG: flagellar hook-length control protein FliK [Gammaproteobacteria bacterium]